MSLLAHLIVQTVEAGKYKDLGGRPVDPASKRQRVLAYLDESPATIADVAIALGVTAHDIYAVMNELKREGQVIPSGMSGRSKVWSVAA